MLGRTLSHYEIIDEIDRGGMGVIYRARDLKLDREVAIKVLPSELVSDPERKRRFIQEAKAAAKLEHPHIAVVHEIRRSRWCHFHCDGVDSRREAARCDGAGAIAAGSVARAGH